MALEYDAYKKIQAIMPVLDDYTEWLIRVMKAAFYQDDVLPVVPESYTKWFSESKRNNQAQQQALEQIDQGHRELHAAATEFLAAAKKGKPSVEAYDQLSELYDSFLLKLHRLEYDSFMEDSGVDQETGLRTAAAMKKDLRRELERRARKGKPFCLVMGRIDAYATLKKSNANEAVETVMSAAESIRRALRSFDDAYRYDESVFVMCLKHTDTTGAQSAIRRVREYFQGDKESLPSMSFCMVEPDGNEEVRDALNNLDSELGKNAGKTNLTLLFREISPLERYVSVLPDSQD